MTRLCYTSEHHHFRELVRDFVQQSVVPNHENWEKHGRWDRSLFLEAGKPGLLGFSAPEHLGGAGRPRLPLQRHRHRRAAAGRDGRRGHCLHTAERHRAALSHRRRFISIGQNGDLFVIAVRTSPDRHKGLSLLVVDARHSRLLARTQPGEACTPRTSASWPSPICGFRRAICSKQRAAAFISWPKACRRNESRWAGARWRPPKACWLRRSTASSSAGPLARRAPAISTANSRWSSWQPKSKSPGRFSATAWASSTAS